MKVLIVLPAGENYRITKETPNVPKRKMLRFSILPLLLVASLTPEEYEVEICDENVQPLNLDTDAEIIGISFMTALAPRAFEIAKEFKLRGKTVIAGGYYPTLCPEETSEHFNAVVIGDAEHLWVQALADLKNNQLKKIYKHEHKLEMKQTPIPRRDLLKQTSQYYVTINAVQIGRGCQHNCKYCSITAFYKGTYRTRPIEEVMEELKIIPSDLIFVDDNIIGNPEYAKELFKAMIPLKKQWVSQCSLKIADDEELLQLAAQSGCYGLFIGVETLNSENLNDVDKAINLEFDLIERVRRIRKAGIGIIAGIILGMDNDDVTVFQNMLSFLNKSGIDSIQVNIMTPLPGTPLYDEFIENNRIFDTDLSKYDFRHVVMTPKLMSAKELQNGADWLYHEFYRLDRILLRFLKSITKLGLKKSLLSLNLNLTYRYDNIREKIIGKNPAAV